MNQATVVKLLPTDYHAARIMRGDNGRVVSEPHDPAPNASESISQATMGSPYLGYQGNSSPSFNMADTQWGYVTSPSYGAAGGYQPAPAAPLTPPGSVAYQQLAVSNHGFMPQVAVSPHPTAYHAMSSPISVSTPSGVTPYQYSDPAGYYPPGTTYGARGPGYAGFVQPATANSGHAYSTGGNDWPSDVLPSPQQQDQTPAYDNNNTNTNNQPTVVVEQRKILIRDLERDGLSKAVVAGLLAQHAGIGAGAPGQIEKLEVPFNKDGRARGTAYVTFGTAELASAAVAALDGRKVGGSGKTMSARLVVEGVSPEGFDGGGRSGRRQGGGGGGGGGGKSAGGGGRGSGSKAETGKPPRQVQAEAQLQAQSQFQFPFADTQLQPEYSTTPSMSGTAPPFPMADNGQPKTKEERPVIVDGSGGRFKKASAPVVVDGSAGKKGDGRHRGSRR